MFIPDKVLHNETQRHVERLSSRDENHIEALDALIRGLHNEGLWNKIHVLCVVAPTSADSLLDLKNNQDSVLVGSPAFVADRGFTTVSVTDYINTQYAPGVAEENNVGLTCYIRLAHAGSGNFMGCEKVVSYSVRTKLALNVGSATLMYAIMQSSGAVGITVAGGGFRGGSRIDASNVIAGGDEATSSAVVASWRPDLLTLPIFVGCSNYTSGAEKPSPNQYAHWSVTQGLGATEMLAYNALIKNYMTARGAAV